MLQIPYVVDQVHRICEDLKIPVQKGNGLMGSDNLIEGKQCMEVDKSIPAGTITYDVVQSILNLYYWDWNPMNKRESLSFGSAYSGLNDPKESFSSDLRKTIVSLTSR